MMWSISFFYLVKTKNKKNLFCIHLPHLFSFHFEISYISPNATLNPPCMCCIDLLVLCVGDERHAIAYHQSVRFST